MDAYLYNMFMVLLCIGMALSSVSTWHISCLLSDYHLSLMIMIRLWA